MNPGWERFVDEQYKLLVDPISRYTFLRMVGKKWRALTDEERAQWAQPSRKHISLPKSHIFRKDDANELRRFIYRKLFTKAQQEAQDLARVVR